MRKVYAHIRLLLPFIALAGCAEDSPVPEPVSVFPILCTEEPSSCGDEALWYWDGASPDESDTGHTPGTPSPDPVRQGPLVLQWNPEESICCKDTAFCRILWKGEGEPAAFALLLDGSGQDDVYIQRINKSTFRVSAERRGSRMFVPRALMDDGTVYYNKSAKKFLAKSTLHFFMTDNELFLRPSATENTIVNLRIDIVATAPVTKKKTTYTVFRESFDPCVSPEISVYSVQNAKSLLGAKLATHEFSVNALVESPQKDCDAEVTMERKLRYLAEDNLKELNIEYKTAE